MKPLDFRGRLVVVTGASSGLGREIARALAFREGADLVLVSRRRERLEQLKAEIEAGCGSRVHLLPLDLAAREGARDLFHGATACGVVFALVNCAGQTFFGRTLDAPIERYEEIMSLNLLAEMKTSMLFLPYFLDRGQGAILTVTSVAAFVPTPFQNVYAASKHGIQAFMEGLACEYRGRGVTFSTFAPGGMATEMLAVSGMDKKLGTGNAINMDAAKAARLAIAGLKHRRHRVVPGGLFKALAMLGPHLPSRLIAWGAARAYRP
jgi:short-subunit dehydrogenase